MLIMDGPGRLVRARRDRDRAGSGEKHTPDPEAQVVVPVVGGVPVAVGRAEVLWIVVPGTAANDAATRGLPGFWGCVGRIKPAAPEDRMAQAPCIRIFRVSDPGSNARVDFVEFDRSHSPFVTKAAQAIAESPYVVFGQATTTVGVQFETEKQRRFRARRNHGFVRV